jgi:UDP-glucose 4-epimerase
LRSIVTGGAGFIGSHLCERLRLLDHDVQVIDDFSSGEDRLGSLEKAGVDIVSLDIRNDRAGELIRRSRPDFVFHLAAQMDVRRSMEDPAFDAEVNILATIRLLSGAAEAGARFINTTSGGAMYGELPDGSKSFTESSRAAPESPYGISKLAGDHYAKSFGQVRGLSFVSLALANVYGPRQDPKGEAGVVSIFGRTLLDGQPSTIYGDGKQTRDFVFVQDIIDAYVAAMSKGEGETFNIGTGRETTVLDLHKMIATLTGGPSEVQFEPPRAGELKRVALDVSKAGVELGWKAKTSLEDGIRQTVEWLRKIERT